MQKLWTADKIRNLRERHYKESQRVFADRFRMGPDAIQFWEQSRGKPSAAATVILDQLEANVEHHGILIEELSSPEPEEDEANGNPKTGKREKAVAK